MNGKSKYFCCRSRSQVISVILFLFMGFYLVLVYIGVKIAVRNKVIFHAAERLLKVAHL